MKWCCDINLIPIAEASNFESGIAVEGFVKAISKKKSIWIDELENYRDVCNARLLDMTGKYIEIGFWENDILKVRNNIKIRITDAKWNITKRFLYKSKIGSIIILTFNPNHIYHDILNLKGKKKITSFKEYHNYVNSVISKNYLGKIKKEYLVITRALYAIEKFKDREHHKIISSAIRYLYKNVELDRKQIRDILNIFNISISHKKISISIKEKSKSSVFEDNALKMTGKKVELQSDNKDSEPFWYGLPDEISIIESSDEIN